MLRLEGSYILTSCILYFKYLKNNEKINIYLMALDKLRLYVFPNKFEKFSKMVERDVFAKSCNSENPNKL